MWLGCIHHKTWSRHFEEPTGYLALFGDAKSSFPQDLEGFSFHRGIKYMSDERERHLNPGNVASSGLLF